MSDKEQPDFETALTQLEELVGKMETGDLTLEQSLDHFQQGVELYKGCQKSLDDAQLKVQQLLGGFIAVLSIMAAVRYRFVRE